MNTSKMGAPSDVQASYTQLNGETESNPAPLQPFSRQKAVL